MYVGVPLAMTGVPYLAGWRGNPFVALFLGNLYHGVATAVGVLFAWTLRGYVRSRLVVLAARRV